MKVEIQRKEVFLFLLKLFLLPLRPLPTPQGKSCKPTEEEGLTQSQSSFQVPILKPNSGLELNKT